MSHRTAAIGGAVMALVLFAIIPFASPALAPFMGFLAGVHTFMVPVNWRLHKEEQELAELKAAMARAVEGIPHGV